MTTVAKGRIVHKAISADHFEVEYQCPCSGMLRFTSEALAICERCNTVYQLRIMIGRSATVNPPK